MANFCSKCGKKNNPDDRFCKNCGANLIESAEVSKEELIPEKPPVPIQIPSKPSKPIIIQIISSCLQLLLLGLFLYLIYYSYGCATGKYPNTGDQMCQSIHQAFSGGGTTGTGGGTTGGGGGGGCTPTGCPSSAPWYGCGTCWPNSNSCHTRGTSNYSDDCSVCRKCP